MNASDRAIKARFAQLPPEDPAGQAAAAARARAAFYALERQRRLSGWEFLVQQGHYIHKRWWVFQGCLLLALWWLLSQSDSSVYVQNTLGIAAPLFVLLLMPELWKSRSANAMEVEGTAYYNLRQVYAARLLLFALVDLGMLTLFFLALTCTIPAGPDFFLHFFLPLNVSCCICFRTLYSRRPVSQAFAMLLCVLWAGLWMGLVSVGPLYRLLTPPLWGTLLGVSLLYLGCCVVRGQTNLSRIWEGLPVWN